MKKDIESLLFDFQKRQEMKQHPNFTKINELWENNEFNSPKLIGNLNYLIKQIHNNKTTTDEKAIVQQKEWIQFYFESGKKRKTENDTYQTQLYYGRTKEELYDIAIKLKDIANASGLMITEQAAINFVYIKIIDDTFGEYRRCFNVIFRLQEKYPELTYSLIKPLESIEYGLDIFVKFDKQLLGAIKVLPRSLIKKKDEEENKYHQKHNTFKMIYETNTYFVYSSVNGYIVGDLPKF